jgi:hypothetical protein
MPSSGMLRRATYIVFLRNVCRLLVTANVIPSSPIFVTLMMEALRSPQTSVLTTATRRNILEDRIIYIMLHILYLNFNAE